MKQCSRCGDHKPDSEFHKNANSGLDHRCKPCACAYQRERHPVRYAAKTTYFRVRDATKNAAKANAPINDLTVEQWERKVAEYEGCCAYCGKRADPITVDHVTPLSRGGSNTASNVVPCCQHCNHSKWARLPEEAGMINPLRQPRKYEQLALL